MVKPISERPRTGPSGSNPGRWVVDVPAWPSDLARPRHQHRHGERIFRTRRAARQSARYWRQVVAGWQPALRKVAFNRSLGDVLTADLIRLCTLPRPVWAEATEWVGPADVVKVDGFSDLGLARVRPVVFEGDDGVFRVLSAQEVHPGERVMLMYDPARAPRLPPSR